MPLNSSQETEEPRNLEYRLASRLDGVDASSIESVPITEDLGEPAA